MASVGASKNDHDTDGILINVLQSIVRIHNEIMFFCDWNQTTFDVEVPDQALMKPSRKRVVSLTVRISQEQLERSNRIRCWDGSSPFQQPYALLANVFS